MYLNRFLENRCSYVRHILRDAPSTKCEQLLRCHVKKMLTSLRKLFTGKEKCLMKTIKRKVSSQDNNKEENAWFNKEIENAIKLRKSYNRQKRNENNEDKKNVLCNLYNEQKKRVQSLI